MGRAICGLLRISYPTRFKRGHAALLISVATVLPAADALAAVTGPGGGPIPAPFPCFTSQATLASNCYDLEVACPAAPTWIRNVRVKETNPGGAAIGNVIFTTGGRGTSMYSASDSIIQTPININYREQTVEVMKQAGYRTFEVQWTDPDGWFTGAFTEGPAGSPSGSGSTVGFVWASCAYAQLASWLAGNRMPSGNGAVCATGNSGGGGIIAHAMTSYAADTFFKAVVYSGGPSTSLPYEICFGASTALGKSYAANHHEIIDKMSGWAHADALTDNYCKRGVPPPANEESLVKQHGLISVATLPSYPEVTRDYDSSDGPKQTKPFIVVGSADSTGATFHANAFYDKLVAANPSTDAPDLVSYPGSYLSVAGDEAKHDIDETAAGAYLIQQRLLNYCVP